MSLVDIFLTVITLGLYRPTPSRRTQTLVDASPFSVVSGVDFQSIESNICTCVSTAMCSPARPKCSLEDIIPEAIALMKSFYFNDGKSYEAKTLFEEVWQSQPLEVQAIFIRAINTHGSNRGLSISREKNRYTVTSIL